ncbi:MAG TPA: hypothetical protein EYO49_03160 [Candidatus Marinimicrobia bacterium]|nr:hypothetical protein [Candidatus Neomarinimicrobiota bacterium]
MRNPVKTIRNFLLFLCITIIPAQEDSTVVDSTLYREKIVVGESETVVINATVNPINIAPTAYRYSIYPRNHPAEPFMQKLFFPGEEIQIILPANILNTDSLGNVAKLEPLGDNYDHQYRMFNAAVGEINLTTFDILGPSDIMKLTVLDSETGNPIGASHVRVTQNGEILSNTQTDTSGYTRVRIPVKRIQDEPVMVSIDTDGRFPTWKGNMDIAEGIFEKTVTISTLKLGPGDTIYEVIDSMVPFREGPENGAVSLFLLNEGDQVVISKVAGDRLFGRVRIYLDKQGIYRNISGWILGKHLNRME